MLERVLGFFEAPYDAYSPLDSTIDLKYFDGIIQDFEGGFLFASPDGGIWNLSPSHFRDENYLRVLENENANGVLQADNKFYIAQNDGLVIYDEEKGIIQNELTKQLATTRIRSIMQDSKVMVWLCTYSEHGIIRYNPLTEEFDNWFLEDGHNSEKTRCMIEHNEFENIKLKDIIDLGNKI